MTAPTIHNPVRLRVDSIERAHAYAEAVRIDTGAPTEVDGDCVVLPGDQPGFLFHILDHAMSQGYATDADCSAAIAQMERGLR